MLKKIAIGLVFLIVVLVVGANYLWSNLDSIIKAGVEKYGSAATQTAVRLDKVKLSLTSGEGTLDGLSVGNPSGFSAPKSFYLGSISVKLDTKSVTGNGPIVIQQISIDKPQITYEVTNSGDSNLQAIARNAQDYAGSFGGNKPAATPKPETQTSPGRKIVINDLAITNGQIAITQPLLQGKQLEAALPPIHLTNIGKNEGGASPAEVAQLLLGTITKSASQVAKTSLTNALGNLKNLGNGAMSSAASAATGAVGNAGSQLKGLFGK